MYKNILVCGFTLCSYPVGKMYKTVKNGMFDELIKTGVQKIFLKKTLVAKNSTEEPYNGVLIYHNHAFLTSIKVMYKSFFKTCVLIYFKSV